MRMKIDISINVKLSFFYKMCGLLRENYYCPQSAEVKVTEALNVIF